MSLRTNKNPIRTNIFTFILFLGLISCFSSMNTRTNSLESIKFDLSSKINNYPFLKTGSKLDPESMQGLLTKMIELSQQPESEKQTKTFSVIIEKVRNLVDEMLKEQKESDVTFKKNSAILIKYFIRSRNSISIISDKYDLNIKLIDLLNNIKDTQGSIDIKVNYYEILENLRVYTDYMKNFQARQTEFDLASNAYYLEIENTINQSSLVNRNNTHPWSLQLQSLTSEIKDSLLFQANAIRNAFVMDINPSKELMLLVRYISIFSSQQNNPSGTINNVLFQTLDNKIKNAENESNNLSVKLENERNLATTSKNSLDSYYDEYVKNTEKRSEIINTILKILDFMNMRIKKVSVKFMVYLEDVKDDFKSYVNSYEFVNLKKYIFKNIIHDEEGKRLTEEFQSEKNKKF